MKHRSLRLLKLIIVPVLSLCAWRLSIWAFDHFGCVDSGKFFEPCFAYGYNLQGCLGFGLFWAPLVLLISTPICGWLLFEDFLRWLGARYR